MQSNYFAHIVKNVGKTGQDGQDEEKPCSFNDLQTDLSCPTLGKTGQDRARQAGSTHKNLAHLAQARQDRARRCEQGKANKDSSLSSFLPILPILPAEIDNCATQRTPDEQEAYEERAAILEFDGNMPRQEAEHKAARCYYCKHWYGTKLGRGWCVVQRLPVRRRANDSCEQFTVESRS